MLFQMQESKYLTAAAAVFCSTWLLLCCCKLAISQEQATPDCHKSKLNVSLVEWDLNLIALLASLTVSNIVINFLLTDKISNHQMARNFGIGLSRAQLQIKCCGMPSNVARNLINYRKPEERERAKITWQKTIIGEAIAKQSSEIIWIIWLLQLWYDHESS